MSVTELDTFIQKFYQLWNAGQTAHLDVDTHAGKAWVGLRVQLGQVPGPLHHHPHPPFIQPQKKSVSPSRQRRRARRAAARLTAEEAANQNLVKERATENEAPVNNEPSDQHQTTEEVEDVVDVIVEKETTSTLKSDEKSLYVTDIDDEICDDEEYFDAIDLGTAMSCLVCNVEHFPANYVKGDKVNMYAVCRWHLGISKCVNCRKNLVGLGVIRDHRRLCRAPPESEASS